MLIISQLPIWDMGKDSGKEVMNRTLEAFSQKFNLAIIAPGEEAFFGESNFFRVNNTFQKKIEKIKLIGHLYNYIYILLFYSRVKKVIKEEALSPDIVYTIGYLPSFAAHKLFKNKVTIVNRYYGVAWNKKRFTSLKEKMRFVIKKYCYKHFGDIAIMTDDGTDGKEFLIRVGYPADKIFFLRNGINFSFKIDQDLQIDLLQQIGFPEKKNIFLTVSRLAGWKRVEKSLQLISSLKETRSDVFLIIVGDGEERENLESLARKLKIEDHVLFAGSVKRAQLPTYYNLAKFFLSFYEFSNAGNPLFEAMLHGKCIITLDNGQTSSFIDSNSAVLLNLADDNLIFQKTAELLSDSGFQEKISQNSKKRLLRDFQTWDQRIETELDIIENLYSSISEEHSR